MSNKPREVFLYQQINNSNQLKSKVNDVSEVYSDIIGQIGYVLLEEPTAGNYQASVYGTEHLSRKLLSNVRTFTDINMTITDLMIQLEKGINKFVFQDRLADDFSRYIEPDSDDRSQMPKASQLFQQANDKLKKSLYDAPSSLQKKEGGWLNKKLVITSDSDMMINNSLLANSIVRNIAKELQLTLQNNSIGLDIKYNQKNLEYYFDGYGSVKVTIGDVPFNITEVVIVKD